MNYETAFSRERGGVELVGADPIDEDARAARRRRRIIIAAIVAALVAAIAIGWSLFSPAETEKAAGGGAAGKGSKQAATVTVTVPGRQTVERVISATGNLGARREMPVGVAGEGGQVTQVLVEPGSWVGAGQVLATVDRRVQAQQVNSLAAQIGALKCRSASILLPLVVGVDLSYWRSEKIPIVARSQGDR